MNSVAAVLASIHAVNGEDCWEPQAVWSQSPGMDQWCKDNCVPGNEVACETICQSCSEQPEPTPTPQPDPTPEPTPTPQPDPTPEPTPTPDPEPTPEDCWEPKPDWAHIGEWCKDNCVPTNMGACESVCQPCSEQPEPTPTPQPEPTPEPTPTPQPDPTPEPTPTPQPDPTPEPTPTPQPEPTPEPTPTPQPTPPGIGLEGAWVPAWTLWGLTAQNMDEFPNAMYGADRRDGFVEICFNGMRTLQAARDENCDRFLAAVKENRPNNKVWLSIGGGNDKGDWDSAVLTQFTNENWQAVKILGYDGVSIDVEIARESLTPQAWKDGFKALVEKIKAAELVVHFTTSFTRPYKFEVDEGEAVMQQMLESADIISNQFYSSGTKLELFQTGDATQEISWPALHGEYRAANDSIKIMPAIPEVVVGSNDLAKFGGKVDGYFAWQVPQNRPQRIVLV